MKRKLLNGYWIVYVPNHPGCMHNDSHDGWEYEHRYLIERKIGRILKTDESVHHINGNKLDNNIDNLELMSRSEHAVRHATENGHHLWTHACVDCGKQIITGAVRCRSCYLKNNSSKKMPSKSELLKLSKTMTNRDIARLFNVSDSAVRKWRMHLGIPSATEQRASNRT